MAPDSNQVAENLSLHDQVRQNLLDDIAIWLGYAKSTISEINWFITISRGGTLSTRLMSKVKKLTNAKLRS